MLLRHALFCWAVLILLIACSGDSTLATGSTGTGGTGGTGGNGGASSCDTQAECGDSQEGCIACAKLEPCLHELNACDKSTECLNFGACLQGCTDDEDCVRSCENQHALGGAIYHNLFVCVFCRVCFIACPEESASCTN